MKKPIYKRWWFIVLIVIVILCVIGSIGGGDSDTSEPKEPVLEQKQEKTDVEEPADEPEATLGEQNALKAGISYIEYGGFSKKGLIEQLKYEGYSDDEAKYGANNCGANWKEEAAESAKSYMDYSSFSREGLIDQLLYEGFTQEQAEYGAKSVGY